MAGLLTDAAQGGTPITPQLAQTAAQAGAPGPQQQPGPEGPQQQAPGPQQQPGPAGPQQQPPPQEATRQVDPAASAIKGKMPVSEEKANPEEQAEYERAMKALSMVLYSNDKTANAIVEQINPNDKVGSTTKANLLLIQQLDEKIQMDGSVIPQMTQEVTSRIIELAEARYGIEYGGRETLVILGATWEGVQGMFAEDGEGLQPMIEEIGPEGLQGLQKQHEAFLNG